MSTLPSLAWSDGVESLLAQCDKTSAKAVCAALHAATEGKDTKAVAMAGVKDLAVWLKGSQAYWVEAYLIALFPSVMSLCADKDRAVQAAADEAGAALMGALNPVAVDGVLPLLFKEFDEHRWQTKLAAVKMLTAMAEASPRTVGVHCASHAEAAEHRPHAAAVSHPDRIPLVSPLVPPVFRWRRRCRSWW